MPENREWLAIVIDTEDYSGSFEREMASYITGVKEEYQGSPWAEIGRESLSD